MKLNKIIYYIKCYKQDPCQEGSQCLVRAGCSLKQKIPWVRTDQCPAYKKYINRRDRIYNFLTSAQDWFWIIIMLSGFCLIALTFIFGIMKWIEFARRFWS